MMELTKFLLLLVKCKRRWQLAGVAAGGALTLLLAYTLSNSRSLFPAPAPKLPPPLLTRNLYFGGHWRLHPKLCPEQGGQLRLLILVSSTPESTARRMAVRLTWGHYTLRHDVTVAFVLGAPTTMDQVHAIAAEDDLYEDLIVSNTVHGVHHTTPRTLSMLEWMSRNCPYAGHLLKADDDVFLNVLWVLSFVTSKEVANASRTVWGRVMRKVLPTRKLHDKNYVSGAEFPLKGPYPDFTTGPAYLMSNDCVQPLLEAATAPRRRYLRLEDVFVTGVLANELGIQRVHTPAFFNRKLENYSCNIERIACLHMVRFEEQFYFWNKLYDPHSTQYCELPDSNPI